MPSHSSQPYENSETVLLTAQEVAVRLAVSLATVRRLIAANELPKVVVGGSVRVAASDLEDLISRGRSIADGTNL